MKRKLDIDEIRQFFLTANAQFEEAGIFIDRIRFDRDKDGNCTRLKIDYEDREHNFQSTNKNDTNINP